MTSQQSYLFYPFYFNWQIDYKIKLINYAAKFVSLIKRTLKVSTLKTGIINGLNKDLGQLYLMVKGLKCCILEVPITSEKAKEGYKNVEKALIKFRRTAYLLERGNYNKCLETEELCNSILIDLYFIEGKLRNLAF